MKSWIQDEKELNELKKNEYGATLYQCLEALKRRLKIVKELKLPSEERTDWISKINSKLVYASIMKKHYVQGIESAEEKHFVMK